MTDAAAPTEADAPDDTTPAVPEPETMHGCPVTWSRGQKVLHVGGADYAKVLGALQAEGFHTCIDLCAVDYLTYEADRGLPPGVEPARFEVVLHLIDHGMGGHGVRRLRVRVQVPADDPTLPTLFSLYPGTEAMEREAFDMVGITFTGHPDPNRILMPEDWAGHPLRKDYASGRIPVQFKATTDAR